MHVKSVIRAVVLGASALVVAGCASTSGGPHTAATTASIDSWDAAPAGQEHYQFAPLPPAETIAQDLQPAAPRSQEDVLADAQAQFEAARATQDLGDDARTYEHFSAMMDRLVEADLDPETFARIRDGYTIQLTAGVTMLGIYERNQPARPSDGPVLDDQVDGTATIHERVQAEIEAIQRVYPRSFQAGLDRSYKYLPYIRGRFAEAGLPEDLVWLAMVESQFTPKIDSHAGAGGMWQFMRGTGRRYGMHIDGYLDERYDWRRSTNAAVQYLSELYRQFDGNWPLAVTAYNMGEGGLGRTIKNAGGEDNLWDLLETKAGSSRIKLESKRFYAKLLATVIVAKNPEQYGFERRPQPAEEAEALKITGFYSIAEIEKQSGMESGTLVRMNPQFLRGYTPPARTAVLAVPVQHDARVRTVMASMPELRPGTHTVQRGETLSQIAAVYHVSVSELQSTNNIKSPRSLRAGQKLVIPGGAVVPDNDVVMASASGAATYTVRRGDTLSTIASKHRVSVKDLQRWNSMGSRTTIRVGQRLAVGNAPVKVAAASSPAPEAAAPVRTATLTASETKYHTVKKGEYPDKIARTYGVKLDELLMWNGLTKRSTIQVGQKLKVKVPVTVAGNEPLPAPVAVAKASPAPVAKPATATETSYHTVKKGENPDKIARAYGVKLDDLLTWNGLTKRSTIQIGQKLKVMAPVAVAKIESQPAPVQVARAASAESKSALRTHTVRRGDTVSTIAETYGVSTKEVLSWNGLSAKSVLQIGDVLKVQNPATAVASAPTTPKAVRVADSGTGGTVRHIHAVTSGENIAAIADHYAVPVETLYEWNGWIAAPALSDGDEVVVFQPAPLPQD